MLAKRFLTALICFEFIVTKIIGTEIILETFTEKRFKGTWARWEDCPKGNYGRNIEVKIREAGSDSLGVVSVCILCGRLSGAAHSVACSGHDNRGMQTLNKVCNVGVTGFYIKYEEYQGPDKDDTGINAVYKICENKKEDGASTGRPGLRTDEKLHCLKGQAICGIQTMFGFDGKDQVGINGIRIKCCDVTFPKPSCKAKDEWKLFDTLDNGAFANTTKTFAVTIGKTQTKSLTFTGSQKSEIAAAASLGLTVEQGFGPIKLEAEFTAKAGFKSTTGVDWSRQSKNIYSTLVKKTYELDIPPRTQTNLYHVVGTCGDAFQVVPGIIFRIDLKFDKNGDVVDKDKIKPFRLKEGFFCGHTHEGSSKSSNSSIFSLLELSEVTENSSRYTNESNAYSFDLV